MDGAGGRKESTSFLKKRSKKLCLRCRESLSGPRQKTKVFWFFFSKKNILPVLACPAAASSDGDDDKSRKSEQKQARAEPRRCSPRRRHRNYFKH
jgi:hypothetical protein